MIGTGPSKTFTLRVLRNRVYSWRLIRAATRPADQHAVFERLALSKRKALMLEKGHVPRPEDAVSADEVIRDPYLLEFLNLKDEYGETDFEEAIIRHLEWFLLELGEGFTFVARQKRIRVGDTTWLHGLQEGGKQIANCN